MRLTCFVFSLWAFVLVAGTPSSALAQAFKPWPPAIPSVSAKCTDYSMNYSARLVKRALYIHKYTDVVALAAPAAEVAKQCYIVYSHPMYILRHAWLEDYLGAAYLKLGRDRRSKQIFIVAKADLLSLSDFEMPPAVAHVYSTVATDLNYFTGSAIALRNGSAPVEQPASVGGASPILINGFTTEIDSTNDYMVDYCVDFTNQRNVAATLIRFRFFVVDGFGKRTGDGFTEDEAGTFSPNVEIHHGGSNIMTGQLGQNCFAYAGVDVPGGTERVQVVKGLFADGSTWTQ